jgi:hypothetical protein
MPQRRILFLSAAQLVVWRAAGGDVGQEGAFAPDAAGLEAFAMYLRERPECIFTLLADLPEEGFQIEDIPHSRGKDRAAIVRRKLGQYFYGTPFALAHSQGRLKTGRRDERLLLMALTQPQHFEPWLEILRAARAILAGIYSLPQVAAALLPVDAPAQLLLVARTSAGLRQTYFANRQLRFSRLTPLATGSAEESAIAAVLEAGKMHQYLSSQRLIERGKPLVTRVLAHPAQVAILRERCRDNAELHFEFADILQEARRVGLGTHLPDSRAEALFCHLLARRTPDEQFAPPAERQFHRLWRTRFTLKAASAVIIAAGLLFGAHAGLHVFQLHAAAERIRQETALDQRRYDDVLRALPRIPLSTENLTALVDRYDQVARRAQGPAHLLAQLSQSLDAFPSIAVERLEWEIVEQLPPPPPGTPPAPPHMANGPYAQATVEARLPLNMVSDHRGQLALVADLVKHLGQAADTLVTVLQPPVDTQSGKTLKSSDERSTPEAPRFSFRLTRKL